MKPLFAPHLSFLFFRVSLFLNVLLLASLLFGLGSLAACSDYLGGSGEKKKEVAAEKVEPAGEKPSLPEERSAPQETQGEAILRPEEMTRPEEDASSEAPFEATPEIRPETKPDEPLTPTPIRSCKITVRLDTRRLERSHCDKDVPSVITSVQIAGEFNAWDKAAQGFALKDPDGDRIWEAEVEPTPGSHAYKYVLNGDTWCLDPTQAEQKYVSQVMNSLLHVGSCQEPWLSLDRLSAPLGKGEIEADITFFDATSKGGFEPSQLLLTMNGSPLPQATVLPNGSIKIRLKGLSPDRYTFRVQAKDKNGKSSNLLYFFAWVEKERFDWKDAIMYFAFVDRFLDGEPSNNQPLPNVPTTSNYQGGDLKGVLKKLQDGYFTKLAVSAIWLSPLYAAPNSGEIGSDGRRYSGYHGYWPIEPRKIEPRFGTWQDLKDISREAHRQGIRILTDLASNHVHKQHPYFVSHKDTWFHPFSSCAPAWDRPIECWFDPFLPDLDYRNFDAASAMTSDSVYWAQEGDLDGFRVDAVKHMINLFTRNLRSALDREVTHKASHFYLVGETFTGTWQDGGGGTIKAYVDPAELSGQFDFPLYWEILGTLGRRDGSFNFQRLDGVVKNGIDSQFYGSEAVMSNFIGNHDVPRFLSHAAGQIDAMFSGNRNKAWDGPPPSPQQATPYRRLRAAFTLLLGLPGIPLLYYGDEIGLPGETDPDNRRMMQFANLSSEQLATLAHVQKVASLRRQYPALRSFKRRTLLVDPERYAFLLEEGQQKIIVALRRSGSPDLAIPLQGLAPDGAKIQDLLRGSSLSVSGSSLSLQLAEDEGTYLLLP